jgi:predicted nucleic acid-binding protein
MTVVADTSPLNYLILIGEADVLRRLYNHLLIPRAVLSELQHARSPSPVTAWVRHRPAWIETREVLVEPEKSPEGLDTGESEALILAETFRPDVLLLMDDEAGRQEGAAAANSRYRYSRRVR